MDEKSKNGYTGIVIVAMLLITISLVLPFWSTWGGGLFPEWKDAETFIDVMEEVSNDFDAIWYYCPAVFRLSAFVPSVLLLIVSLFKSKAGCIIFSVAGIGLIVVNLIRYVNENNLNDLFDFADGQLSFAVWLSLIMFVVCFFQSLGADN